MELQEKIFEIVDAQKENLINNRRDLHAHPETGWTEFRTACKVAKRLTELGYEVLLGEDALVPEERMGLPSEEVLQKAYERAKSEGADEKFLEKMKGGLTAVVGIKKFAQPGKTVGLRFDMDCNDVSETNEATHRPNQEKFASQHCGEMHACGHDGHTSIGLMLAEIFANPEIAKNLSGTIKLFFQPAEEGVRGARAIVAKGLADDVDYMLGAHLGFQVKHSGQVACDVKGFLATTKFDVTFTGRPAHAGAAPEQGRNALLAAATAALNLHAIARHSKGSSRINVGTLVAGSGRNVIADKAVMKIETRGGSTEINEYMEQECERIIKAAAQMYDVAVDMKRVGSAAGGMNSPEFAKFLDEEAAESHLFEKITPTCDFNGSEDYTYFMERVQQHHGQAAFIMVGTELKAGHHNDHFDFNENALPTGAKFLAKVVTKLLTK